MFHNISTLQGFGIMGAALAAVVAIVGDYYTSVVGLQHGFVEANPLNRWLFTKIGQSLTAFIEGTVVCWVGAWLTDYGVGPAAFFFGAIAVSEGYFAIRNYLKLRAAKISL